MANIEYQEKKVEYFDKERQMILDSMNAQKHWEAKQKRSLERIFS